jgi:NADP-dependent 3-hydroxy acid dehydrogenase YdfG
VYYEGSRQARLHAAYHTFMPVSLKDKVALVIGASSGVGRACALQLAAAGAKVMASARREERLKELQREAPIEIFPADATDAAAMTKLAEATVQKLGPIDLMVYASGTNTLDRHITKLNPTVWHEMMATNLDGAFFAAYAVLPGMRARKTGHLIFISSISGHTPDASGAAYQASKRGLIGLSHAIRTEDKENGIRTTVINPGLIDSELLLKRPVKPTAEQLAVALQPEHIAETVLACAMLPPRAVVSELTIMPSAM